MNTPSPARGSGELRSQVAGRQPDPKQPPGTSGRAPRRPQGALVVNWVAWALDFSLPVIWWRFSTCVFLTEPHTFCKPANAPKILVILLVYPYIPHGEVA